MAQVIWNPDIDVYNPLVMPFPVARTITWFLDVPGLLLFSLVSRNTHKAVNDNTVWVALLKGMSVWESGEVPGKDTLLQCRWEWLSDPLTCLDRIFKVPKLAKFQVCKVLACLQQYYEDLQRDVPYNSLKIFRTWQTPQAQAKILRNLLKYNSTNPDERVLTVVYEKITELIEIFENALLRELEIHYDFGDYDRTREFVLILLDLRLEQNLTDFFLQKTCFDNESTKLLTDAFDVNTYFRETTVDEERKLWEVVDEALDAFVKALALLFNQQSAIIDKIFPQLVPMMYRISEELIGNQLQDACLILVSAAKERNVYFVLVPLLYSKLTVDLISQLRDCENVGETYHHLIQQLIDAAFELLVAEYVTEEKSVLEQQCSDVVEKWKEEVNSREQQAQQQIWKHVRVEAKNDFLLNFKKVFISEKKAEEPEEKYSAVQAQAKLLAENIKLLNKMFSPELALDLLNDAKQSLARLHKFAAFSVPAVKLSVFATMQDQFMIVVDGIASDHLRPGLERALKYLHDYSPKHADLLEKPKTAAIDPLVIFFEGINMADTIVQMVDIFYKEEMLHRKVVRHENSVLNPSLQAKKNLEALVDKFVADGLNNGIDVLFREIELVYILELKEEDYCPPPNQPVMGPTPAAKHAVEILDANVDLLVDCADKLIVEVFQQEVAERFFQLIVKILKRSSVSVDGAVTLISDLNFYHDFIVTHIRSKKRLIFPLFQALKKVGSIYLISGDDAKAIGQLVSDLLKFNGIFSQEEIYEFVQRRQDWAIIKRHVEKVMYGISLGDCTIM